MQYKDSINIGSFMLFAFITIAIVVEIFRSGKANLIMWQSLLPKSKTEVASFVMFIAIILNTFNWSVIYLISLLKKSILLCTDYIYMLLSVAIFFGATIRVINSIDTQKFNVFLIAASIFSARNIYQYWYYFKKKSVE